MSMDRIAEDEVKRLLSSETSLRFFRFCSPYLQSPDSPLRKKLKYVDASDLADKLRTNHLCDKPACEEIVRATVGNAAGELDYADLLRDNFPVCPIPSSCSCCQSQNNMAPTSSEVPVPVARAPTAAATSGSTKQAPATDPAPATSHGSKLTVASLLLNLLV
jgi:hypothetical protein